VIILLKVYGAYANVRDSSWRVLLDYNVHSLPINTVSIACASGISIIKNSEVNELKSTEVGVSILDKKKWYIVYDDTVSKERIRFTIAHELGHIFLGHPLKLGYHARTIDADKPETEKQADMFAIRLLAPACVIWGLGLHTAEEIQKYFNISYSAAKARASRMQVLYERNKFLQSELERKVYSNFEEYIRTHRRN
jgi:Zn-dependent peptidase ImmA (M78 family)